MRVTKYNFLLFVVSIIVVTPSSIHEVIASKSDKSIVFVPTCVNYMSVDRCDHIYISLKILIFHRQAITCYICVICMCYACSHCNGNIVDLFEIINPYSISTVDLLTE